MLEIEHGDSSIELRELELGEGGFATAAFEARLRDLNRALQATHRPT